MRQLRLALSQGEYLHRLTLHSDTPPGHGRPSGEQRWDQAEALLTAITGFTSPTKAHISFLTEIK